MICRRYFEILDLRFISWVGFAEVVHWYMNRPGVQEMRAIDANLYICLAMRNYNRGPPMIPDKYLAC